MLAIINVFIGQREVGHCAVSLDEGNILPGLTYAYPGPAEGMAEDIERAIEADPTKERWTGLTMYSRPGRRGVAKYKWVVSR